MDRSFGAMLEKKEQLATLEKYAPQNYCFSASECLQKLEIRRIALSSCMEGGANTIPGDVIPSFDHSALECAPRLKFFKSEWDDAIKGAFVRVKKCCTTYYCDIDSLFPRVLPRPFARGNSRSFQKTGNDYAVHSHCHQRSGATSLRLESVSSRCAKQRNSQPNRSQSCPARTCESSGLERLLRHYCGRAEVGPLFARAFGCV
jgi:hypothetical protein